MPPASLAAPAPQLDHMTADRKRKRAARQRKYYALNKEREAARVSKYQAQHKCPHGRRKARCAACDAAKATDAAKAADAAKVVRTFPACNLYHALSPSGSGERWGDLQQPAPPSFLQQSLPPRKLPPPPPSSFKPLQWGDADDEVSSSGTRWDEKALGHAAGVLCLAAAKRALHGP
jgi:hypothetical protein